MNLAMKLGYPHSFLETTSEVLENGPGQPLTD
jgi:hypothetical protein